MDFQSLKTFNIMLLTLELEMTKLIPLSHLRKLQVSDGARLV